MKCASIILVLLLGGCFSQKDTAQAIKAFRAECKSKVSAVLTLGNYGNDLKLSCAELKLDVKEPS